MAHPTENLVSRDQFAKFLGIQLVDVRAGQARLKMPITPHHLNGLGVVQGGAIFSLADTAFAAACNARGIATVAIHADISFVKKARGPVLWAQAAEIKDAKVGLYEVRITEGDDVAGTELVAVFQGLSYQLSPK